ncbi:MAG: PEP-CTERM sorting domain-containing protein [bacterium]
MRVYIKEQKQPLRWLVAAIVFVLAMSITFSDLYGLNVPSGSSGSGGSTSQVKPNPPTQPNLYCSANNGDGTNYDGDFDPNRQPPSDDSDNPETVPEPATLLLVSLGMGAAYVMARRKRQ